MLDIFTGDDDSTANKKKPSTKAPPVAAFSTPVVLPTPTLAPLDIESNSNKDSASGSIQTETTTEFLIPNINIDKISDPTANIETSIKDVNKDENPIITAENLSQVTNQLIESINANKMKDKKPTNANNWNMPQKVHQSVLLVHKDDNNLSHKPQIYNNDSGIENSEEAVSENIEDDEDNEESDETKHVTTNNQNNSAQNDDNDDYDDEDESSEEEDEVLSTIVDDDDSEDEDNYKLNKRKHKKD